MIEPVQKRTYDARTRALREAVHQTLAYADIFNYPLSASELHRYLHDVRATAGDVHELLTEGLPDVDDYDGFYVPAGKLRNVAERRRRKAMSAPLLQHVRVYTRILKYLPFVRMVGLTGSLAMQNVDGRGDIDLMIVTAPGRVWLGRAIVIAVVHLARLAHDPLCPNYVVAENALTLDDSSVYDAHELAQMVPLYGQSVYMRLWASNPHITAYLPNARPWPMREERVVPLAYALKRVAEHLLGGALGDWLEAWERRRKVVQLRRQHAVPSAEIVLSPEQCKGHFDQHRAQVLQAYAERLGRGHGSTSLSLLSQQAERREVLK